jgi:hypothetical protein
MNRPTPTAPVDPAARIRYPDWADRARTRVHSCGGEHFLGFRQWKAPNDDVIVRLDLTRLDDYDGKGKRIIEGDVRIRLGLTSTAYVMSNPGEDEVPLQLDADLDAADCRKLAAHLLAAADRLEDLDVAEAGR